MLIILILVVALEIFTIIDLTSVEGDSTGAKSELTRTPRKTLIAVCVGGAIEIVVEILGIVVILRNNSCGNVMFIIYQTISTIVLAVTNIVVIMTIHTLLLLMIKATIEISWGWSGCKRSKSRNNNA